MKKLGIIILIILSFMGISCAHKGLKGRFTLGFIPDKAWSLYFYKNNTYEYHLMNFFNDKLTVLDSGTYNINNNILTFQSLKKNVVLQDNCSRDTFYIKTINIKRSQTVKGYRVNEKNTLFGKKVTILMDTENEEIEISDDE